MSKANESSPLGEAAKAGDVAQIRALLADGAEIEAKDINGSTPIMLAAQVGQAEAFHTLVELGANLHALALNQRDLLESAAQGGNPALVRFLIEQGHPLEGHWQPRSQASERMGHITPLIMAAIHGRVEVVRLLLEAGADRDAKFDRRTALQIVKSDIKHPITDEQVRLKPQFQEIVALLKEPPAER